MQSVADPAAGKGEARNMKSMRPGFASHLFYELFLQGQGGVHDPLVPPLDPLLAIARYVVVSPRGY